MTYSHRDLLFMGFNKQRRGGALLTYTLSSAAIAIRAAQ